jgi:anoctamin-10/anoctamin-7
LRPFDYIFAGYDAAADGDGLYRQYPSLDSHKHVFRAVDRINLILSVLECGTSRQPPGAGLNISKLVAEKVVLAAFPLHDYDSLKDLQRQWLDLHSPPWRQPIIAVKDYFGDRIGFYFLYLQHYVEQLMVPAVVGCVVYVVREIHGTPENILMPYFAAFMMVWAVLYLELWKRKQSTAAMKWGMVGFLSEEQDRPVFGKFL